MTIPILFLSDKDKSDKDPTRLPVIFQAIERWALAVKAGVSSGYASLTGTGQSTTPGNLTQQGGFDVESPNGGAGFTVQTNLFGPADTQGIKIYNAGGSAGSLYRDDGGGGIVINATNTGSGNNGITEQADGILIQDTGGVGAGITMDSTNNGVRVTALQGVYIANVLLAPSTPGGGGKLFTQAGALKYRGSAGTITTIAPA